MSNMHIGHACPICLDIVNAPIELSICSSIVCANCCCSWFENSSSLICPCCYTDHVGDFSTLRSASNLIQKILRGLLVKCAECGQKVLLNNHSESECIDGQHQISTLQDILESPIDASLTNIEQKVKRSLTGSTQDNLVRVKTGGQVSC